MMRIMMSIPGLLLAQGAMGLATAQAPPARPPDSGIQQKVVFKALPLTPAEAATHKYQVAVGNKASGYVPFSELMTMPQAEAERRLKRMMQDQKDLSGATLDLLKANLSQVEGEVPPKGNTLPAAGRVEGLLQFYKQDAETLPATVDKLNQAILRAETSSKPEDKAALPGLRGELKFTKERLDTSRKTIDDLGSIDKSDEAFVEFQKRSAKRTEALVSAYRDQIRAEADAGPLEVAAFDSELRQLPKLLHPNVLTEAHALWLMGNWTFDPDLWTDNTPFKNVAPFRPASATVRFDNKNGDLVCSVKAEIVEVKGSKDETNRKTEPKVHKFSESFAPLPGQSSKAHEWTKLNSYSAFEGYTHTFAFKITQEGEEKAVDLTLAVRMVPSNRDELFIIISNKEGSASHRKFGFWNSNVIPMRRVK